MLIGYSMPVASAVTLGAGTDPAPAWLTADAGAACTDGKPARKARFQWNSNAIPAIGQYVQVLLTIPLTSPRVCAILGLANVPAGTVLALYGKRAGDAAPTWNFGGGNTGTVQRFADGTFGCWFVLPAGAEAVTQIAFRIFNNNAGATWATPATTVDVGELVAMPGVEIKVDVDYSIARIDPSQTTSSRAAQLNTVARSSYRELACTFSPDPAGESAVRFGGLANGMDWESLASVLTAGGRCAVIPRWASDARIQATAQYGIASEIGETVHLRGPFWNKPMKFREIPSA